MDCKENGVSDPSGCAGDENPTSAAMDINESFSEKAGEDIDLLTSLETPQVVSVLINPMMEPERKCFTEIEQMGEGNSVSKALDESSDAVYCVADDTQKPGVVSDEAAELAQGSVSDAIVPGGTVLPIGVNDTEEAQRQCFVEIEQMRDGSSVSKEHEENADAVCCVANDTQKPGVVSDEAAEHAQGTVSDAIVPGGTILPVGVSETGTESAFLNDAPEQLASLETAKDIDNDEAGNDGFNCTFGGGGKEGSNEPSGDQDAAFSDDISFIRSSPFPDSVLDSGGFGCNETENHMKSSSDIDANMPLVVSPSLAITEMISNNDGGPSSYALDGIVNTETINPDLRLVHDDELHTDLSEKNEKLLKNHVGTSSSESDVAALSMNDDMAADPRAQNFSRISPLEENTFDKEANAPITDPSLMWTFPLKFGNGGIGARNPEKAEESIRIVDGNGRIGGEVASASGTSGSSLRRRSRVGKQGNISQTKRSAPHPRKSARNKQSERNLESIFNCSKQKRSSVSKPDRSSQWGLPCRTAEIFLQGNNIPYGRSPHHETKQPQNNAKYGEHNSSNNGYVEGSNRNIQASSGSCLRLKVKFGKSGGQNPLNVTVSKVSGNSLPAGGVVKAGAGLEFPGPADVVEDKLQTLETREQIKEKNNPVEKLSCRLLSDSITDKKRNQDAGGLCRKLGGDVLDEGTHLSSSIVVEECERANGARSLDAETSPDSEVINSVPDSTVSIGLKEDLPHGFSSTAEDVVNTDKGLEKQDELLASISPLENGSHLIPNAKKGKHPKSKGNVTRKGKSRSKSAKGGRKNESQGGLEQHNFTNMSAGNDDSNDHDVGRVDSHETTGALLDADIGKTSDINGAISQDVIHGETVMDLTIEDSSSTESAWVRCDDCFKWRRIPASVVGSIDDSSRWICMNNSDKDFAHCSISQEMSNEEINEELGIGQDEADAYDDEAAKRGKDKEQKSKRLSGNKKACFRAIKTNQFLHRNRKNQTIDEIMVCHCKPPPDGRQGCGEECLNRMLNIECLHGTCPTGDLCSNQQFQKRKYVKFERFQSGKKGYGLRLLEDVREGQFLIEYVGEVLDMQSYESRQKDYASMGQKHFYFMTLNGNEVIDAGAKGNLGRFINHSCEPNCRTEKWMVNGEICVGIFSMQDLKKGQELTFDYNYVRVFGAAAKKCYCGSSHCRGYIGGDPLNGDVVVQSDSDEEYPELVILDDDESGEGILEATPRIFMDSADMQMPPQNSEMVNDSKDLASQSPSSLSVKLPESEILPSFQLTQVSKELSTDMPVIDVQQEVLLEKKTTSTSPTSSSPSRLSSDGANAYKTVKQGSGENKKILSRSRPRMKTSRSSGSSKQDKGTLPGVNKAQTTPVKKLQQQPIKSKGSEEVSPSGRIETFEGKLNELLDVGGGISKRRDSAKGYLKLLLLTAASRGSANEGIQSNRDLSMILDALLKTKSRTVLVDVINKNEPFDSGDSMSTRSEIDQVWNQMQQGVKRMRPLVVEQQPERDMRFPKPAMVVQERCSRSSHLERMEKYWTERWIEIALAGGTSMEEIEEIRAFVNYDRPVRTLEEERKARLEMLEECRRMIEREDEEDAAKKSLEEEPFAAEDSNHGLVEGSLKSLCLLMEPIQLTLERKNELADDHQVASQETQNGKTLICWDQKVEPYFERGKDASKELLETKREKCAHQVFDQMHVGGKRGQKKRKKKRTKIECMMKRIKQELRFRDLLVKQKRVLQELAQWKKLKLKHKACKRKKIREMFSAVITRRRARLRLEYVAHGKHLLCVSRLGKWIESESSACQVIDRLLERMKYKFKQKLNQRKRVSVMPKETQVATAKTSEGAELKYKHTGYRKIPSLVTSVGKRLMINRKKKKKVTEMFLELPLLQIRVKQNEKLFSIKLETRDKLKQGCVRLVFLVMVGTQERQTDRVYWVSVVGGAWDPGGILIEETAEIYLSTWGESNNRERAANRTEKKKKGNERKANCHQRLITFFREWKKRKKSDSDDKNMLLLCLSVGSECGPNTAPAKPMTKPLKSESKVECELKKNTHEAVIIRIHLFEKVSLPGATRKRKVKDLGGDDFNGEMVYKIRSKGCMVKKHGAPLAPEMGVGRRDYYQYEVQIFNAGALMWKELNSSGLLVRTHAGPPEKWASKLVISKGLAAIQFTETFAADADQEQLQVFYLLHTELDDGELGGLNNRLKTQVSTRELLTGKEMVVSMVCLLKILLRAEVSKKRKMFQNFSLILMLDRRGVNMREELRSQYSTVIRALFSLELDIAKVKVGTRKNSEVDRKKQSLELRLTEQEYPSCYRTGTSGITSWEAMNKEVDEFIKIYGALQEGSVRVQTAPLAKGNMKLIAFVVLQLFSTTETDYIEKIVAQCAAQSKRGLMETGLNCTSSKGQSEDVLTGTTVKMGYTEIIPHKALCGSCSFNPWQVEDHHLEDKVNFKGGSNDTNGDL